MKLTIPFNDYNNALRIQIFRAKDEFGLSLSFDSSSENTISFGLTLPFLFRSRITLDSLMIARFSWWEKFLQVNYGYRDNGITIDKDNDSVDGGYNIIFNFWRSGDSSEGGISKFINTNNVIFGDVSLKKSIISEQSETIYLSPMGNYDGDYYDLKIVEWRYEYTWPRFNRFLSGYIYEVECEKGVPHRIKFGRQDRCYSISYGMGMCSSKEDALKKFISEVQGIRSKL